LIGFIYLEFDSLPLREFLVDADGKGKEYYYLVRYACNTFSVG
jgi:hypothetical protein